MKHPSALVPSQMNPSLKFAPSSLVYQHRVCYIIHTWQMHIGGRDGGIDGLMCERDKIINVCVFECFSLLLPIKENVVLPEKKEIRHLLIHPTLPMAFNKLNK